MIRMNIPEDRFTIWAEVLKNEDYPTLNFLYFTMIGLEIQPEIV